MGCANARLAPRWAAATAFLLPVSQISSSTPLAAPALRADRMAASAPPTISAAAASATAAPAIRADLQAAPAPMTISAAAQIFAGQTEYVAARKLVRAARAVAQISPARTADAFFDCLPHGFPCTRSGHSALARHLLQRRQAASGMEGGSGLPQAAPRAVGEGWAL